MKNDVIKILHSWMQKDVGMNTTQELMEWINIMNQNTVVRVEESIMKQGEYWFYNEEKGRIENQGKSFFSIRGIQYRSGREVLFEQPIIFQPEIGFLEIGRAHV